MGFKTSCKTRQNRYLQIGVGGDYDMQFGANLCLAFQNSRAMPETISSQVDGSGTSLVPPPVHGFTVLFLFFPPATAAVAGIAVPFVSGFLSGSHTFGRGGGFSGVQLPWLMGS